MTYQVTKNLNRVIDRNYYPIPEARNSNMRHRPVGLGVQGLADAFILMRLPFDSEEARQLNKTFSRPSTTRLAPRPGHGMRRAPTSPSRLPGIQGSTPVRPVERHPE